MTPSAAREARQEIRDGRWSGPTVFAVPGAVQCNLVVLVRAYAYDFAVYCQRNPKPCPLIEITDPGIVEPRYSAPGADLRTDLPKYTVFRNGVRSEERTEIKDLWKNDSVGFLIGSSLSFDHALERAGVPRSKQVWVLNTSLQTAVSGPFGGPVIVTMRWMTAAQAIIATQLTSRFAFNHGAPIHIGDPAVIGADLTAPLFGEPVREIPPNIVPVFWGCGVTPQQAAQRAKLPLMITHSPGHGFITDLDADQICIP